VPLIESLEIPLDPRTQQVSRMGLRIVPYRGGCFYRCSDALFRRESLVEDHMKTETRAGGAAVRAIGDDHPVVWGRAFGQCRPELADRSPETRTVGINGCACEPLTR
jgi:hypothetical protein